MHPRPVKAPQRHQRVLFVRVGSVLWAHSVLRPRLAWSIASSVHCESVPYTFLVFDVDEHASVVLALPCPSADWCGHPRSVFLFSFCLICGRCRCADFRPSRGMTIRCTARPGHERKDRACALTIVSFLSVQIWSRRTRGVSQQVAVICCRVLEVLTNGPSMLFASLLLLLCFNRLL